MSMYLMAASVSVGWLEFRDFSLSKPGRVMSLIRENSVDIAEMERQTG
jgi:hypothetical protein